MHWKRAGHQRSDRYAVGDIYKRTTEELAGLEQNGIIHAVIGGRMKDRYTCTHHHEREEGAEPIGE